MRVMASIGKPDPRLPLLGLTALIQNHLQVAIDGENSRFPGLQVTRSCPYRDGIGSFSTSDAENPACPGSDCVEAWVVEANLISNDDRSRVKWSNT